MSKKEQEAGQAGKSKKKWIIIGVVAVVLIAAAVGGNKGGDQTAGTSETEPSIQSSAPAETDQPTAAEPEANTSAKVDALEQAICYGYWLEYAYADDEAARDYAELGMDMEQAVKYVYRGAEKVEDDATQENLGQIKKSLEAIGQNVE